MHLWNACLHPLCVQHIMPAYSGISDTKLQYAVRRKMGIGSNIPQLLPCVNAASAAVPAPQIDLLALSAAANAAANTTLTPPFDYGANDITGLLASFVFEDVGVTAYNGAAPLITDKSLLGSAVGIGLVEAYHAGIVSLSFLVWAQH